MFNVNTTVEIMMNVIEMMATIYNREIFRENEIELMIILRFTHCFQGFFASTNTVKICKCEIV